MQSNDSYGFSNPPYTLYQGEDGRWGLVDKDGKRLPAIFERSGDIFHACPWEAVEFDPDEGMTLVAWFDPCEVWFNFTFDNPAYPEEYAKYLWKESDELAPESISMIKHSLPEESRWLIDIIAGKDVFELDLDDESGSRKAVEELLAKYPALEDAAITSGMIRPAMNDERLPEAIKIALWRAKVSFDHKIMISKEETDEGSEE